MLDTSDRGRAETGRFLEFTLSTPPNPVRHRPAPACPRQLLTKLSNRGLARRNHISGDPGITIYGCLGGAGPLHHRVSQGLLLIDRTSRTCRYPTTAALAKIPRTGHSTPDQPPDESLASAETRCAVAMKFWYNFAASTCLEVNCNVQRHSSHSHPLHGSFGPAIRKHRRATRSTRSV
jgi:hypothetical protein